MPAAGFGIALEQRFGFGVEEEKLKFKVVDAKRCQLLRKHRDAFAAATVDSHCYLVIALLSELVNQLLQQLRGQIVNAIVCRILKHVEGDRLAGTREASDDYDVHVLEHSGTWLTRASRAGLN